MAPRDRDVLIRKDTPMRGSAIPHEVEHEGTGVHEGDELRAIRERRPTPERIRRLEKNGDDLRDGFDEFKTEVVGRLTKVETHVEQLVEWKKEERAEQRQRAQTNAGIEKVRLNNRGKIIVALIGVVTAGISVLGTLAATGKL